MSDAAIDRFDVVILGGGPVGSLVAALVRRQDPTRRVLVLEKTTFPRHHVGESSIPSWRPILERAGVLEKLEASDVMRKVGTLFQWGRAADESWTIDFRDRTTGGASVGSYQVDRARFDHLLLEHARSLGATVHESATVKAVRRETPSGFQVEWEQGESASGRRAAHADYVVDASGQARLLARLWELRLIPFDDMNNFAVYGYWKGSAVAKFAGPPAREDERWTYISTCPDGWVWHIPTFPDLVSVGVVTDAASLPAGGAAALEEFYVRNVRASDGVGALLAHAELVPHPLSTSKLNTVRDWSYHAAEVCGPGWFLTGDAAAFVDPILSSGLLIGAHGASLAANALCSLWNDPAVDAALLRKSYQAAYENMAGSYHRLARIWYSRNFKYGTWHWEAKRQRLRTGRHPAEESNERSFLQVCLGSFANPIEGAFGDPGLRQQDLMRPDMRIYAAHLFRGEIGADRVFDHADEDQARRALHGEMLVRWRQLLESPLSTSGCVSSVKDSYFTDGKMDHWERVRYLEVMPRHSDDPFERVVFPLDDRLPDGIAPLLDGARPLRAVLETLCAAHPVGTARYRDLLTLAHQQVLQLDLRDWLAGAAARSESTRRATLPEPFVRTLHSLGATALVEIDLLGQSALLTIGEAVLQLSPAARTAKGHAWAWSRHTAFAYRGNEKALGGVHDRLLAAIRSWEADEPEEAAAFWPLVASELAGDIVTV